VTDTAKLLVWIGTNTHQRPYAMMERILGLLRGIDALKRPPGVILRYGAGKLGGVGQSSTEGRVRDSVLGAIIVARSGSKVVAAAAGACGLALIMREHDETLALEQMLCLTIAGCLFHERVVAS
jgi:hypothetical protein